MENNIINQLFSLEGKIGIVTGGNRGIGYDIAKLLANAGAKVYSISRNNNLTEDYEYIQGVEYIKGDISDYNDINEKVKTILKNHNKLDFLVNNAGVTLKKNAEEFNMDEWQKIHDINVNALFNLCKICYPYLKKSDSKGRIVNITSMAAHLGFTGVLPYCSSKSAVLGITRALSVEWANENILVNSVAPGWIYTKMTEQVKDKDRINKMLGRMSLHEFGEKSDIANMVLFLVSNGSKYITGQDFAVDGGALSYGY